MTRLSALFLLSAACGRIGFSPRITGDGGDSAVGADAAIDAPGIPVFAYWPLDDGSGIMAADASGHNHPLTLANGAAWAPGMFGQAVTSDGVDDFLTAPLLDLSATAAVTVSIWSNRVYNSTNAHTLYEFSSNANFVTTGFGLYPDDTFTCGAIGRILIFLRGDAGYSGHCFGQPSSSVWHHLVVIYDKSRPGTQETQLYIDGFPQLPTMGTGANDNTNNFGAEPFFLLSRDGSIEFNTGAIDDVKIFDRALTPAEITQI